MFFRVWINVTGRQSAGGLNPSAVTTRGRLRLLASAQVGQEAGRRHTPAALVTGSAMAFPDARGSPCKGLR